jgi:hypothetical protein
LIGPARSEGATIALSSSSNLVSIPSSVNIPGGTSAAQFAIATSSPAASTEVQITASIAGVPQSATFTITPAAAALVDLVLTSSTVEGGTSLDGNVILGAPAPAGGALVMLSSTIPQIGVQSTVVVRRGCFRLHGRILTQSPITFGTDAPSNACTRPLTPVGPHKQRWPRATYTASVSWRTRRARRRRFSSERARLLQRIGACVCYR